MQSDIICLVLALSLAAGKSSTENNCEVKIKESLPSIKETKPLTMPVDTPLDGTRHGDRRNMLILSNAVLILGEL